MFCYMIQLIFQMGNQVNINNQIQCAKFISINQFSLFINTQMDRHILTLFSNTLDAQDRKLREKAEEQLAHLKASSVDAFVDILLNVVKGNIHNIHHIGGLYSVAQHNLAQHSIPFRILAIAQLRLCLCDQIKNPSISFWGQLKVETQQRIKAQLFQLLCNENNIDVRRELSESIGKIAGYIISKNPHAWLAFKDNLWGLLNNSHQHLMISGLTILSSFTPCVPYYLEESFDDVVIFFENGLARQQKQLKIAALQFLVVLLDNDIHKRLSSFNNLRYKTYRQIYALYENHGNQEGIDILLKMLNNHPDYFQERENYLVRHSIHTFYVKNISNETRMKILKITLQCIQKGSYLFGSDKQVLRKVVEMFFTFIAEVNTEATIEWKQPFDDFNEIKHDSEFQATKFAMDSIHNIFQEMGDYFQTILNDNYKNNLKKEDWRYNYAAMMVISQIGSFMVDLRKPITIFKDFQLFLASSNPKLRYAACYGIGQLFQNIDKLFQNNLRVNFLSKLLAFLQKEQVPRVVSRAAIAMSKLLSGIRLNQIVKHSDKLVKLLISLATHEISLVRESAIQVLISAVSTSQMNFQPYIGQISSIILSYFEEKPKAIVMSKLLAKAIQLLTIIANKNSTLFLAFVDKLVRVMFDLQTHLDSQDPHRLTLICGWQLLCLTYGKQISRPLLKVIPYLLSLTLHIFSKQRKRDEDEAGVLDSDLQEIMSLTMLRVLMDKLQQLYYPFMQKTSQLLCKVIKQLPSEDIKKQVYRCIPKFIKVTKSREKQQAISIVKEFLNLVLHGIYGEQNLSILQFGVESLKHIILQFDAIIFSQQELSLFSKKILNIFKKVQNKKLLKLSNKQRNSSSGEDEDDQEISNVDFVEGEQKIQFGLINILCTLFKSHKDMALDAASQAIDRIIASSVLNTPSNNMLVTELYLIHAIMDNLGQGHFKHKWNYFGTTIMENLCQNDYQIRQISSIALGVFAIKTPQQILNIQTIKSWLNRLKQAANIPKGQQSYQDYRICRRHIISVFAKIINFYINSYQLLPYFNFWISCLPFMFDQIEVKIHKEAMVNIMLIKGKAIASKQMLLIAPKILEVCCQIITDKFNYNTSVLQKVKELLIEKSFSFFNRHLNRCLQLIGQNQQKSLSNFIKE